MDFLKELGIEKINSGSCSGPGAWGPTDDRKLLDSINPATGEVIAQVAQASEEDYDKVMEVCLEAFKEWRTVPGPQRGLIVRDLGNALREKKEALGKLA